MPCSGVRDLTPAVPSNTSMAHPYHQSPSGVFSAPYPSSIPGAARRSSSYASVLSGVATNNPSHLLSRSQVASSQPTSEHRRSTDDRPAAPSLQQPHESRRRLQEEQRLDAPEYMANPGPNVSLDYRSRDFFVPSYMRWSTFAERLKDQYYKTQAGAYGDVRAGRISMVAPSSASSSVVNIHKSVPTHRGMTLDVQEKPMFPSEDAFTALPSRWDAMDKYPGLEVTNEGSEVKFSGASKAQDEAAACRSDWPIPKQCGIYYYEVTIINKHKECQIGVGLSGPKVTLNRLPGWESDSWAYHSDDGFSFNQTPSGKTYGPKFSYPDVIGCGINFSTNSVFYTRNGLYLGVAFRDVKADNLRPAVGMQKSGEHVRVNFGQQAFVYDIDGFVKHERESLQKQINRESISPLSLRHDNTALMPRLIAQYLAHEGYVETAKLFAKELQSVNGIMEGNTSALQIIEYKEDSDAIQRQGIRAAVLEGDIDKALKHTQAYYPGVFANNENIYFRLKCRKFIELIRKCTMLQPRSNRSSMYGPSKPTTTNSRGKSSTYEETDVASNRMDVDDDNEDTEISDYGADVTRTSGNLAKQAELMNEALLYGQELRREFKDSFRPETRMELEETFALIAYPDARDSVLAPMLETFGRYPVAEELSSAILVSLGKSSTAAIERLVTQSETLITDLSKDAGPAALIHLKNDYLQ